jgi:hypothetical protein
MSKDALQIIGLGYKARHGKDAAAKHLCDKHGYTHFSFAEPLYEECRSAHISYWIESIRGPRVVVNGDPYGTPYKEFFMDWMPRKGIQVEENKWVYDGMKEKDSELLQWWGLWRREMEGSDYFVAQLADRVFASGVEKVVIPDVRYLNEAAWIKAIGGVVWNIARTNGPLEDIGRPASHRSEVELDGYDFDAVIWNDGTQQELGVILDLAMRNLKGAE